MPKMINGIAFEINAPYAEGHVVNAAEARVLNQTRSENIGNNLRAKLKELAEAGSPVEELQALVTDLDSRYEFTLAEARASRQLDPVEKEALKIAKEALKNHLAETGRKLNVAPEGYSEDEWADKIEAELDRIVNTETVLKIARERVKAKQKQADTVKAALEGASV